VGELVVVGGVFVACFLVYEMNDLFGFLVVLFSRKLQALVILTKQ
jgi:hypothetical protein